MATISLPLLLQAVAALRKATDDKDNHLQHATWSECVSACVALEDAIKALNVQVPVVTLAQEREPFEVGGIYHQRNGKLRRVTRVIAAETHFGPPGTMVAVEMVLDEPEGKAGTHDGWRHRRTGVYAGAGELSAPTSSHDLLPGLVGLKA